MSNLEFEWDPIKAELNRQKHGITFEEALTVFDNPLAVIFDGEEHSIYEMRESSSGIQYKKSSCLFASLNEMVVFE